MTYKEIQDQIMSRLNLTSTDARVRIKGLINDRYRQVTSSTNLARTRRSTATMSVTAGNATVGAGGIAKILAVTDPTLLKQVLREVTLDQIRQLDPMGTVTGNPYLYAIVSHTSDAVTLHLFPKPSANNTLLADVLTGFTPLVADSDVPAFPSDYHDLLVSGVMSDELNKLEKSIPLAERAEDRFQSRVADLRYFLAKSAYLKTVPFDTGMPVGMGSNVWPYTNFA